MKTTWFQHLAMITATSLSIGIGGCAPVGPDDDVDEQEASAKLTVKVQYVDEQTGTQKETWATASLAQLLAER